MNKFSWFLVIILFFNIEARAQGENNVWCFGWHTGLNFNGGNPSFFEHSMETHEGGTSVSDPSGNLLFYSSGSKVWDRNGNLMPNGSGLSGNLTSSKFGVAIVPSVSNPQQYYIFTTEEMEGTTVMKAYYHVVDMSLNGGMGDVVISESNVLMATNIYEGMMVTAMDGCGGFWCVFRTIPDFNFMAFRIDASGVATTPVVSPGTPGISRFNNKGDKIIQSSPASLGPTLQVFDFDRNSGTVSNVVPVGLDFSAVFFASSPDDRLCYMTNGDNLYQVDLSLLPNASAVINSTTQLAANINCSDMKLGPDNKIYVITQLAGLTRINNPDAAGMACNTQLNFMAWPAYSTVPGAPFIFFWELGNAVPVFIPGDTVMSVSNLSFCESGDLHPSVAYRTYDWSTGSTNAFETVTESGEYWVRGLKDCTWHVDTFHVNVILGPLSLGPDTFICEGDTRVLDASKAGAQYLWQDGSTDATFPVSATGNYYVEVTRDGCTARDSVFIEEIIPKVTILADTIMCIGDTITLYANAIPASSSLLWDDGNTDKQVSVAKGGTYQVTATSTCGILTDAINISEMTCNCTHPFVPNAFTPNGDDKNEILKPVLYCPGLSDFYFAVYNRFGQRIFESNAPDQGWTGMQNGQKSDIGAYFYWLKYKTNEGVEVHKKGDVILLY